MPTLPLVLEPADLEALGASDPLILDLRGHQAWRGGHIPGSLPLGYGEVVRAAPPTMGLLPDAARFTTTMTSLGLTAERPVVAYDDEGGGRAARLLFTLEVFGHGGPLAMLNGGLEAWCGEGRPLTTDPSPTTTATAAAPTLSGRRDVAVDKHYILSRLGQPDVALLDTRSQPEFSGADVRAARGGHIPGAVNLNWTDAMDASRDLRLRPDPDLRSMLEIRGVTPDKEVIVYCQTHHRSAHTYWVLRHLEYPRVRGYPGAWSEWGNDPALPVETGA